MTAVIKASSIRVHDTGMTTDDLILRAARSADFPAIAALHALAFARLATSHHSPAQIAAHERLTREPAYADAAARGRRRAGGRRPHGP